MNASRFTDAQVLELIATGAPVADSLDALCRLIDQQSGQVSAIHVLDADGTSLKRGAGPHLPGGFRRATDVMTVTPLSGTCGAAVDRREPVIVTDPAESPLFADLRDIILEAGIGTIWSTPFFSKDGRVLGTFVMFDRQAREPIEAHRHLVQRATYLASIAVERNRTEEALRRSERLLTEAQRLAHIGSWNWDLASGAVTWSDELYRIFGVQPLEIQSSSEAMAFVARDDRDVLMRTIDTTLTTKEPFSLVYRIHRHDGNERILYATGRVVSDEHGTPIGLFGITQDVTEREQAEEALRRSEQLLRLVLEALPVGVAVMNPAGDIVLSNPTATRIWGDGLIRTGPERYATSKGWWHDTGKKIEPDEWASARARLRGETSLNELIDIESYDGVRKILQNSVVPIRDEHQNILGCVVINEDVSARKTAERDLEASLRHMRTLTGRLMRAQDDERRRIARMLHETTAQDLAGLKMHLARLHRTNCGLSAGERAALEESITLADQSMAGIRTLSYLLHPPFLDEAGLVSALRWYATGFAERSGIQVELELPAAFGRLPQDVETTLFRVVQEALINIHRHADSEIAYVRLTKDARRLVLEIEDRGRGLGESVTARLTETGQQPAVGVGIAGMRERLQQLSGTLEIESSRDGTTVRALVPLESDAS